MKPLPAGKFVRRDVRKAIFIPNDPVIPIKRVNSAPNESWNLPGLVFRQRGNKLFESSVVKGIEHEFVRSAANPDRFKFKAVVTHSHRGSL